MINPPPIQGDTLTETPGGRIRKFSVPWQQWFSAAQAVLQGVAAYGAGSRQTLSTGFSVQFPQDTGILLIKSAAPLASGTVTLPASPVDAQQVTVAATRGVAALTVAAAAGQAVASAPAALGAGSAVSYWFSSTDSTWYVIAYTAPAVYAVPQNSQSVAYTLVLGDAGKHILHPSADVTARIWTIPANASVAFAIGSTAMFVNQNAAGVISIAITTDVLRLAGAGTTGTRTLAANGIATALKVTATEWIISGTGLT